MKLDPESKIKGDLGGAMAVTFQEGVTLNTFCAQHIPDYNPERLKAFALRVFYGKEISITLYATDTAKVTADNTTPEKMPVKKFKLDRNILAQLLPMLAECNFTLTTGEYPLEDMEVINK